MKDENNEVLIRATGEGLMVKIAAPMADATAMVAMAIKAIAEVTGVKPQRLLNAIADSFEQQEADNAARKK